MVSNTIYGIAVDEASIKKDLDLVDKALKLGSLWSSQMGVVEGVFAKFVDTDVFATFVADVITAVHGNTVTKAELFKAVSEAALKHAG